MRLWDGCRRASVMHSSRTLWSFRYGTDRRTLSGLALAMGPFASSGFAAECEDWKQHHPEWLWCDEFESGRALRETYEDVNTQGISLTDKDAYRGARSLMQRYEPGQVTAGWIVKISKSGYPDHVFVRWYHGFGKGYDIFPPKMARIRSRRRESDWQDNYAVHVWMRGRNPIVDVYAKYSSQANSTGWLPVQVSDFVFDKAAGKNWMRFEIEIKLNQPGEIDGLYRLWLNDDLIVDRVNADLRGNTQYKINEIMLDGYWNGGATGYLERYYDNFVISTRRIGGVKSGGREKKVTP